MKDLHEVRRALVTQLGSDGKFSLVNARLILRTGINLSSPRPGEDGSASAVARAVQALREMGFLLDGGEESEA
jgi:hypothetical protein